MDENIKQGQAVRAAICFLIIVSGLAIVARLVIEWSTKWTISKKKLSDNVLGILALVRIALMKVTLCTPVATNCDPFR